jgi:spermidine/putrescine transport system substrate-binding protein
MAWSGDIFQLNLEGDASGLQFAIPSEGVVIWTDNMCIPVGVENPVDAITYMDYVYSRRSGQGEAYVSTSARCRRPPTTSTRRSPRVRCSRHLTRGLHLPCLKTPDEQAQWNALFQPIYQG